MTLSFEAQVVPLQEDSEGTIRVGGTRVRLDTVIHAFNQGHTAEEIVSNYPSLSLADVYATITYYLNNQDAVNEYVRRREVEATLLREEIESEAGYKIFRERLLARRQERQSKENSDQ
jgi:uncharacterized protein (DUF433 family)